MSTAGAVYINWEYIQYCVNVYRRGSIYKLGVYTVLMPTTNGCAINWQVATFGVKQHLLLLEAVVSYTWSLSSLPTYLLTYTVYILYIL